MKNILLLLSAILLTLSVAAQNPDWTAKQDPFRIADNLYYVGSKDLASFLITTSSGNILINANLESSPPLIKESVKRLGFKWKDIKILLNGQAHSDHMGGAAQIIKETGAKNLVMIGDADVVESGGTTDFAFGPKQQFPKARVDRILHDREAIVLGDVRIIAHKTAGHTRGSTTFTIKVHVPSEPATKMRNVVIVGGLTVLDEYRLVAKNGQKPSYPGIAGDFQAMFTRLLSLPCDIFLGAHGSYFNMQEKLARMEKEGVQVWIDAVGYRKKIMDSQQAFLDVLTDQRAAAGAKK